MITRHYWCARALSGCLAALLAWGAAPAARAANVDVKEIVLDNGMTILLVPRPGEATVACGWVAKVGSVNEGSGTTGLAHLFEHLMFKGTKTIGTKDWRAEEKILHEMDRVRADLRQEEAALVLRQHRGEVEDASAAGARTPRHSELLARYQALLAQETALMVKNEFDSIYTEAGKSFLNAGTNTDMTLYFVTVPSNKLELWAWLESDRLANPVFREFYSERDVVWEERRLRTDSTPTGRLDEQFDAMFWQASPYSWPVIGWPTDLDGISREEAFEFFERNYSPNNLTAVLVGGFDVAEAERIARQYFGRLERSPVPPTAVRTWEPEQIASKRLEGEADASPEATIRWHAVPYGHVDLPELEILQSLLSGKTGRLEKSLVQGAKIATSTSARADFRRYGGFFEVSGVAAPGHEPEEVERALEEELRKLAREPVPERELQKVKNQALAQRERQLGSSFFLMFTLMSLDVLDDWRDINTLTDELLAVTAEDVRRVAGKYFPPQGKNVAIYRTRSGATVDPAFEAFTAEQRAMAGQLKSTIDAADAVKLEQSLARLAGAATAAPPEVRPVFVWAEKYARERLATLKGAKP